MLKSLEQIIHESGYFLVHITVYIDASLQRDILANFSALGPFLHAGQDKMALESVWGDGLDQGGRTNLESARAQKWIWPPS